MTGLLTMTLLLVSLEPAPAPSAHVAAQLQSLCGKSLERSFGAVCSMLDERAAEAQQVGETTLTLDGPAGSGRFWALVAKSPAAERCLATSTVGWRRSGRHWPATSPLPWVQDLDGDGEAELIVWWSPTLQPAASMAEHTLVPAVYAREGTQWVYRPALGASLWRLAEDAARDNGDTAAALAMAAHRTEGCSAP